MVKKLSYKSKNNNDKIKDKKDDMIISSNVISQNTKTAKRTPKTKMIGNSTTISHTETYGINILGSSEFSLSSTWAVQPGIASYSRGTPLGSWLPQIAGNFDNYEILNLRYTYRAACSTLEPGLVVFGYEPNPEGSAPLSYQELRNMHSVDGSAHANLTFDVTNHVKKPLLIRKKQVVNPPSYDAGKIYLATIGCTDNAKLGFVDVSYVVRLFNPQSQANTTEIIPAIFETTKPTQVLRYTGDFGQNINVANNCLAAFSDVLAVTGTTNGANLASIVQFVIPAFDFNINGCIFKDTARSIRHFQMVHTGRYRLEVNYNCDFEDLKLFSVIPIVRTVGNSWQIARQQVCTSVDGTSPAYLNVAPKGHRGFSGTAVGDPNPGTDMPLIVSFDLALEAGMYLAICFGVKSYNSVSTSNANISFRSGLGEQVFTITYLGPLLVE